MWLCSAPQQHQSSSLSKLCGSSYVAAVLRSRRVGSGYARSCVLPAAAVVSVLGLMLTLECTIVSHTQGDSLNEHQSDEFHNPVYTSGLRPVRYSKLASRLTRRSSGRLSSCVLTDVMACSCLCRPSLITPVPCSSNSLVTKLIRSKAPLLCPHRAAIRPFKGAVMDRMSHICLTTCPWRNHPAVASIISR